MSELKNALDWITLFFTRPAVRGWVMVTFICLALGLGGYAIQLSRQNTQAQALTRVTQRLRQDERTACLIQKQGLPEGVELAAIFSGIDRLIILPQTEATKQLTLKLVGFKEYERQQQVINQLHRDLSSFRTTVGGEPLSRICTF